MLKLRREAGMLCCAVCETEDSDEQLTIAPVVRHVVAADSVPVLRGEVRDLL